MKKYILILLFITFSITQSSPNLNTFKFLYQTTLRHNSNLICHKKFIKTVYPKLDTEITCALIKPEIIKNNPNAINKILNIIEYSGFEIISKKCKLLSQEEAAKFYHVHKEKVFFNELIEYITSGPIIILVLKKSNAINLWRNIMGNTDPKYAHLGTIRKEFGTDKEKNAVHGSDCVESANYEIQSFFPELTPILYKLLEPLKPQDSNNFNDLKVINKKDKL